MQLENVRAVVTGAASGIGYRFALELLRAGAAVAAGDVNEAGLAELRGVAAGLPGTLFAGTLDVTQEPSVKQFVEEARKHLGEPNTLVNCAGVLLDGLLVTDDEGWIRKLPSAQWKRVHEVNLTGPFMMTREVVAGMLESGQRPALVVNVSSLYRWGNIGQSAYSASKGGLDALTRTWSLELSPQGIRVVGLAPGLVDTPMLDNVSDEAKEVERRKIPMGRFGTTDEIWLALKFAIECEYFNGSILEVDGGAGV
jgi:3-oxoacyl-[acyl-carrier protein] reductase